MRLVTAFVILALSALAQPARACPCASGDPALTQAPVLSSEGPPLFRLGTELRLALDAYGAVGLDRAEVTEVRLESTLTITPMEGLVFTLLVPVAYRVVTRANLSREEVFGLADPELRVRFQLLRAGSGMGPRHGLDGVVGIDLPLMPEMRRPDGTSISMEAMIASGSADPLAGLLYHFNEGPVGLLAALTWRFPTPGALDMTMGPSLDANVLFTGTVLPEISLRGAIDARYELAAEMPNGPMPNTGGGLLRVGGDVLFRFVPELVLAAGVRGPVLNAMLGDRDPGFTGSLLVMGDIRP